METINIREARRLALARAGLLQPRLTGFPASGRGRGKRARAAAHALMDRFGYLQLDTVAITGARSHVSVLLSRFEGFAPDLGEELLRPEEPVFEYWGHEACWLPMTLYPAFDFRRREYCTDPWWGDIVKEHPRIANEIRHRLRNEGPLRSTDLEGERKAGWWELKTARRVAGAMWSSGEIAIRERRKFQRVFDLAENVIPETVRKTTLPYEDALDTLILKALDGHGWATGGTLARTWRLTNCRPALTAAFERLCEQGAVLPCALVDKKMKAVVGWIRPTDLELATELNKVRPRRDQGVLLSPFDPVLWDRQRVLTLFGFDQTLEIFKPPEQRVYGYYCMPVLAGEQLVGRYDLKADRRAGTLNVVSYHAESANKYRTIDTIREASESALARYAAALSLDIRNNGRIAV